MTGHHLFAAAAHKRHRQRALIEALTGQPPEPADTDSRPPGFDGGARTAGHRTPAAIAELLANAGLQRASDDGL